MATTQETQAQYKEQRERRAKMEHIMGRSRPLAPDDSRHGKVSTYQNHGCRCQACKSANASDRYKRKYGITIGEKRKMLIVKQEGKCAVCPLTIQEQHYESRNWHIDHCHESGKVRAILCTGCNTALGMLKENPERIRALADYAEKCQEAKAEHRSAPVGGFTDDDPTD